MGKLKHKKPEINVYEILGESFTILITLLLEFYKIDVSAFLILVLGFISIRIIMFIFQYIRYFKEIECEREEIIKKVEYLNKSYSYKNNYIELLKEFSRTSLLFFRFLVSSSEDCITKETVFKMLEEQTKHFDEIILKEER